VSLGPSESWPAILCVGSPFGPGFTRHRSGSPGTWCRVCADAVEHAHAIGPTTLERAWGALVAHARQPDPPAIGPGPNTEAWEHLPDLAALSEQLGAALG
jgi:hypothetical protein